VKNTTVFRLTKHSRLLLYPGLATPFDAVVIMILDSGEWILVDSGSGTDSSLAMLSQAIAQVLPGNARLSPKLVVNTHGHINNAGGDWWFHKMGSIIAARSPDSRWIEEGDPQRTASSDYGLVFHPAPVGLEIREEEASLEVGSLTVGVVHTPGHTPGSQSILLDDEDGRLLAIGDALGSLSHKWDSREEDWWKSYSKIKDLNPDILCTSLTCYIGRAAKEFLERVGREGPSRVED